MTAVLCGLLTFAGLHADGSHSLGHDAHDAHNTHNTVAAPAAPGPSCAHDQAPSEPEPEHGHPSATQGRASDRDGNGPIVLPSFVSPVAVVFTAAEPEHAESSRTKADRAGWPLLISLCVSRT